MLLQSTHGYLGQLTSLSHAPYTGEAVSPNPLPKRLLYSQLEVVEHARLQAVSLVHSFAKLITKTIAIRLSRHMTHHISTSQSALTKGRCIHDNFLYVRNLASAYHRTKTPALLFKLDISKAFNAVSWEYLVEMLEHRGFSARWRDWITLLLHTSHSSAVKWNIR